MDVDPMQCTFHAIKVFLMRRLAFHWRLKERFCLNRKLVQLIQDGLSRWGARGDAHCLRYNELRQAHTGRFGFLLEQLLVRWSDSERYYFSLIVGFHGRLNAQ